MNRLQKKCFIVATGLHLLLALILLIGPAFLTSSSKPEDVAVIEFLPDNLTDGQAQGGGSPNGGAPTPIPLPPQPTPTVTPPTPAPAAEKLPTPEPPKPPKVKPQEVTPPTDDPAPTESARTTKPNKIEISTTPVIRKTDAKAIAQAKAAAEAKAAAKAAADQNSRIASALNSAASRIEGGVSKRTDIKLSPGSGGGGPSYGNWLSAIKKIYTDAWIVPDGVTDDSATVTATVTIARNGDVLTTSIVRASGNPIVDHSVKATLDRVTTTRPLPEGAKEDQRTVTINFNVKAKLGLG